MAQLFRDISLVTFGTTTIDEVGAVEVLEGGQEISSTADDATEQQLVDLGDMTTVVSVYSKDLSWMGFFDQGAAAGTLAVVVKSADGGGNKTLTFSGCRFMNDEANPKHGSIESACVLHFECQSTAYAEPLAVTDS
jgi:hypothetical protein